MSEQTVLYMPTTVRLNEEIRKKLIKIGAAESLKDGKDRTMLDIVTMLVKFYEEHKK
jgi:hypothetical protein